eukprot:scaffold7205_cov149-Isochrysis_galbana.AAC.1
MCPGLRLCSMCLSPRVRTAERVWYVWAGASASECGREVEVSGHTCVWTRVYADTLVLRIQIQRKPFLAFLATGQHGAAELRVGPDGRLPGRATVTEAAARRRAARGAPNGTVPGLAVAGQQRHHRHTLCRGLSETAQRNRGASALHLSKPHNRLLS